MSRALNSNSLITLSVEWQEKTKALEATVFERIKASLKAWEVARRVGSPCRVILFVADEQFSYAERSTSQLPFSLPRRAGPSRRHAPPL